VKPALEDHDVRPAGRHPGQFERAFNRLRAGIAEEKAVQARGQDRTELIDQFQQGRAPYDIRLAVQQFARLLPYRRDDAGMGMPGACHADPGGEVQISCPILVVEIRAFSAGSHDVGITRPNRG
jgi:hypothetical protein